MPRRGPTPAPLSWRTAGRPRPDPSSLASSTRPTLDLDTVETADARQWQPVTVAAYQVAGGPASVLVEVGASGPPTRFEPGQARRLSTALFEAADIVASIRAGDR